MKRDDALTETGRSESAGCAGGAWCMRCQCSTGRAMRQWAVALALGACSLAAFAQDAETQAWKFTLGMYPQHGGNAPAVNGTDLNLRYSATWGNSWVGFSQSQATGADATSTHQVRAGWDATWPLGPENAWRLQPSLQMASGGFWGGSLMVETGERWFAGAGLGRTNLRPYVNLNFDPNDAWMLSGGYRWGDSRSLSALVVRDNRQNPDQQHIHLVYRTPVAEGQRLTLDVLHKRGLVEGQWVRRVGASVTYDWPQWFVRLAYDPKANFGPQDMWRLSTGVRF